MNNKINIAEILKDCPKGMKLYSPIYGKVELWKVNSNSVYSIMTATSIDRAGSFTSDGRLYEKYPSAECLLFPSSVMRDWTKFFKRGDVVYVPQEDEFAIFESWSRDDYIRFNGFVYSLKYGFGGKDECDTKFFVKADNVQKAKFIADIERLIKGKYNPETLQVEPVKPKCPFKSFDKVLIRDSKKQIWIANYFSLYYEEDKDYPYVCMGGSYRYCIPYEHTAHLLGTTDPYTEGGSE